MKKGFRILLVAALLLCACAMPIHAEEATPVHIYLDAPVQAETGDAIAVALYVNGADPVGGVQGTIGFDSEQLQYVGVTLRDDVKALGNTDDVTYHTDGTGVIEFVTLSNVTGGNAPADAWLTVNFTLKAANAGDVAAVTLRDVVVSDTTGEARLTATLADTSTKVMVIGENDRVDMDGATIRTSMQNQGIRFQASPDLTGIDPETVTEVGVVMLPTKLLYDGQDLTKETIGKHGVVPAVARITAENADKLAAVKAGETVFATLTNGLTGGRANVEISARAYVVVNGETIYSYNAAASGIVDGMAGRSLVSVAQAIAAAEIQNGNLENTLGDVLTKTETLTDEEVLTLLTFCRDHIAWL